jgi:membrane protease YdiL (CAAX protease family)
MEGQRFILYAMGPQLFFGCWILFGPRWNWSGAPAVRRSAPPPHWPISLRQFSPFLLLCGALAFLLPTLLTAIFDHFHVPHGPYAAAFLAQIFLCGFLLTVRRRGTFAFLSGHFSSPMAPVPVLARSAFHYLRAVPLLFLAELFWIFLLTCLRGWGLPIVLRAQELPLELRGASIPFLCVAVAMAVAVAPLAEELLFRAAIYRFLRSSAGPRAARWATSFCFAILHWNLCAFFPLFVLSLLLIRAYEEEGNLFPCVGMHALFNGNGLLLFLMAGPGLS